jgi:hypothetical protein
MKMALLFLLTSLLSSRSAFATTEKEYINLLRQVTAQKDASALIFGQRSTLTLAQYSLCYYLSNDLRTDRRQILELCYDYFQGGKDVERVFLSSAATSLASLQDKRLRKIIRRVERSFNPKFLNSPSVLTRLRVSAVDGVALLPAQTLRSAMGGGVSALALDALYFGPNATGNYASKIFGIGAVLGGTVGLTTHLLLSTPAILSYPIVKAVERVQKSAAITDNREKFLATSSHPDGVANASGDAIASAPPVNNCSSASMAASAVDSRH